MNPDRCPYCGLEIPTTDDLRAMVSTYSHPARRHGHHLYAVPTASSIWWFWAPDLETLCEVVNARRGTVADLSAARLVTMADVRMLLDVREREGK